MPLRTLLLAGGLACIAPSGLAAQTIAGRVVEADADVPVPGAFVVMLDDDDGRVAAGLTGDDGRFSLRAPRPGAYRVRVQRIGYRATTTEPVELARGAVVPLIVPVPGEAVEIEGVRVEGEGRCELRPEEGGPTHALWSEARKALEVAEWTVRGRPLVYEVLLFERLMDPAELVTHERAQRFELVSEQPFVSHDPDSLAANGYAQRRGSRTVYYGPDATVLLSDAFLDRHCFRRVPGGSALVGLAFSPVEDRLSDVRGTLWLDRRSAELRELEFRFVRPPIPVWVDPAEFGGAVRFRRLPDGAWIISHWKIRTPTFHQDRSRVVHSGFRESEGDLLSLADTLGRPIPHPRRGARLEGRVVLPDGAPAAGAAIRLAGTPFETRANQDGRFGFEGLPSGRYRLQAEHPDLSRRAAERIVEVTRGATTRVRIGR